MFTLKPQIWEDNTESTEESPNSSAKISQVPSGLAKASQAHRSLAFQLRATSATPHSAPCAFHHPGHHLSPSFPSLSRPMFLQSCPLHWLLTNSHCYLTSLKKKKSHNLNFGKLLLTFCFSFLSLLNLLIIIYSHCLQWVYHTSCWKSPKPGH